MSSTTSSHNDFRVVGGYRIRPVASNDQYVTHEGFEVSHPERKVRAKGYVKPATEAARSELSSMIKVQIRLANIYARLRQKREATAPATAGSPPLLSSSSNNNNNNGGAGAGGGGGGGQPTAAATPSCSPSPLTDRELGLYCSFKHLRLLIERVQTSNHVYVFKDLMPCSLQTILSNGRLDEDGAFYYFFQLLMALHFLHEHGVVHRNISAEHLYISDNGSVLRLGGVSFCLIEHSVDEGANCGALGSSMSALSSVTSNANPSASSVMGSAGAGGGLGDSSGRRRSPTPQPGSYGICSQCHRDVPIVAEPSYLFAFEGDDGAPANDTGVPPLNQITTTCRYCGTMQNRMHILKTVVGTSAFLPPEVIAYQPLQSAMSNSAQPASSTTVSSASNGLTGSGIGSGGGSGANYTSITEGQARDMWSCGVVLYFMLTCTLPFDPRAKGGTAIPAELTLTPQQTFAMCARIAAVQYSVPSYVSPNARKVVEALLVRDPRQRPTARQLMDWPCFARVRKAVNMP